MSDRRREEGYRYIREYRVKHGTEHRFALWERRDGRMRRVGTSESYQDAYMFLFRVDSWDGVLAAM